MRTHKIVKVDWEDSASYSGWRDRSDGKRFEVAKCTSCGILVKARRGSIGVTHSIEEGQINGTIVISRKAITKMEVVHTFRR